MPEFYSDGQVTLLQGDVRAVLRELPAADSVNCVVTSPPYWSLRDYGVEPTVWGEPIATTMNPCTHGSPETWNCCHRGHHQWGDQVEQQRGGTYSGRTRWQHIAGEANEEGVPVRSLSPESWGLEDGHPAVASGQFCRACGAWLGALGLEPTPELFIAHMVEVFREVRRVLRPDGLLWVNMGDSYASNPSGQNGTTGTLGGGVPVGGAGMGTGRIDRSGAGLKPKDLVGIPWMLAFALRADGWWLRQDIIWSKPNPMPESVTDRCTKAHEYLFLLSKRERYWSDFGAIREPAGPARDQTAARRARADEAHKSAPTERVNGIRSREGSEFHDGKNAEVHPDIGKNGRSGQRTKENLNAHWDAAEAAGETNGTRNKRSVWHIEEDEFAQFLAWKAAQIRERGDVWLIPTAPFPEAHFATFPPALVEPCILAGCPEGGTVLDPFVGSGTTAMVARQLGRRAIGIDLNPDYLAMAVRRIGSQMALIGTEAAS